MINFWLKCLKFEEPEKRNRFVIHRFFFWHMEFSWPLVAFFWYIIRHMQETGVNCGLNVEIQGWRIWKRLRKQETSTDYKKGNPTSYRIYQAGNSHSQNIPLPWFFFKRVWQEKQKGHISPSLTSWVKRNLSWKMYINTFQTKMVSQKWCEKKIGGFTIRICEKRN